MNDQLQLTVSDRHMITSSICRFEFRRADGGSLPPFQAGAHLKVKTPAGVVRSYSLTNDDAETDRYVIAVKREDRGRGGSASMHDALKVGDTVSVTPPANVYALGEASKALLIAGGIGITPIIALFRRLMRLEVEGVTLIYCTRAPEETAYFDELSQPRYKRHIRFHHSASAARFDFWPYLRSPDETQIYYCGPQAMMDAIHAMSIHWPRRSLHFESFSGASASAANQAFKVRQAGTKKVFEVPADKTILEVLREQTLKPLSSCETGTCGTCRMRLIEGVPDHRDLVLSEAEKADYIMPCVSRAFGGELTLEF